MDFFDVVKHRYSHKAAFKPDAVPEDHLKAIVSAGVAAPSGMNTQSTEFIIVTDAALRQRIGALASSAPLNTAPALIAVVSNPQPLSSGTSFYLEDYAAATMSLTLAATALGYASGWIDVVFRNPQAQQTVRELLGIPESRLLTAIVPVGLPAEPGQRRTKKPFEQRASWDRYGAQC